MEAEDVFVNMANPHYSMTMARAAGLVLTVLGCSGDTTGPTLAGDALRVPLAAAIHQAQRSTSFFAFGAVGVVGLVDLTIAQMVASGAHDRSRTADGVPTDRITQEHYDATAFLIAYDIITPTGLRLTGETLTILSWAGLDLNRGVAQALRDLSIARPGETVTTGSYGPFASGFYFFGPEGRVWEIQPSPSVELTTLTRPSSARGCRGAIPETVSCEVYTEPGRAAGIFELSAREVGPGTSPSNFQFQLTAFDLPVTALRIVDTVRFAGP
jgi:hypothetical protein